MKSCAVLRLLLVLNRNLTLNPNRRWLPTGGRGCVVGIKITSCLFEGLDCRGHLQPRSPDIGATSHFPTSIFLPTSSSGVGDHTTSDSMPRKRYFCGAKADYPGIPLRNWKTMFHKRSISPRSMISSGFKPSNASLGV